MDAFEYPLPEAAIAQVPVEPRDASRLLVATSPTGEVEHRRVLDLPELVRPGDVLVVNDTRVVPARLRLRKATGAEVEVLLLERRGSDRWDALVRPGRRVPPGTQLVAGAVGALLEVGEHHQGGVRDVRLLEGHGPGQLERWATLALPPYVHHELADPERYQTVYATNPGSVAAPTAGLHLTEEVLERCRRRGAEIRSVDLAVGLGTFAPVTAARPEDHVMHAERYRVPAATVEACRRARRVVAVGTTSVRALESVAATGRLAGRTSLFIRPGHRFRAVDALLTNFHQPRSSLLLLLHAFCGERWQELYRLALEDGYRFLSFGDAMLVAGPGR